jgi:hypothetical protein
MKKFVIFTLIGAMAAGAVFAADGVNINAWGRGTFAPLIVRGAPKVDDKVGDDDKAKLFTGVGNSWGGNSIRVDFRIVGNAEYIGFGLNATAEQNRLMGNDDAAYIWAKPFSNDFLKIKLGMLIEDELRGKIGTANNTFDNFVLRRNDAFGNEPEDRIFYRFRTFSYDNETSVWNGKGAENGRPGFLLSSQPIDPLFIGLLVVGGNPGADQWPSWGVGSAMSAYDAWNYMQLGAGYKIEGIGHVRAQYIGGFVGTFDQDKKDDIAEKDGTFDADKPARIEAAFALTAVEGLFVDLGGKFWLPITEDTGDKATTTKDSNGIQIALGATFRMEALAVAFRFDGAFASYNRVGDKDESLNGGNLDFRLNPSYDLDFATLGVVFGLQTNVAGKGANSDDKQWDDFKSTMRLGFGGYAQKGLGKGSIKAGLTFTTAELTDGKANGSTLFSIPVILEYAFF